MDEFVLVVTADRHQVVALADVVHDRPAVGPLAHQVADEDDEIFGVRVQRLHQAAQFVDAAVDVADDVDVVPQRGVDPPVPRGDRAVEVVRRERRPAVAVRGLGGAVGGGPGVHTSLVERALVNGCYDHSVPILATIC